MGHGFTPERNEFLQLKTDDQNELHNDRLIIEVCRLGTPDTPFISNTLPVLSDDHTSADPRLLRQRKIICALGVRTRPPIRIGRPTATQIVSDAFQAGRFRAWLPSALQRCGEFPALACFQFAFSWPHPESLFSTSTSGQSTYVFPMRPPLWESLPKAHNELPIIFWL